MLTKDNFKELLYETYDGNIEPLEEYVNANTSIKFFCHFKDENGEEHGVFSKTPYQLITLKRPCKKCLGNKKPSGYWNNMNNCIEEAKKYRNKYELQKKCYGCYNSFVRHGWVNELNNIFKESIVLYGDPNDRIHCVYVYLIEEYKKCYVGRTKLLERRDKQHRYGYRHSNGDIQYDNLWKFCHGHDVVMPQPIILESELNATDSQIKEDEWLKKYISDGYEPLNIAPTGENIGSLGATLKWDYEACKEEAKKYNNKYEMKIKNQSAYNSCVRNKWIDDFFENKKKPDGYWHETQNVLDAATRSENARDMVKKFGGAYNMAKKLGILSKLKYKG